MLVIGILRLVSVKSTNYVEHVSEYGVHWNFLFTIVFVKVRFFYTDIFSLTNIIFSVVIHLKILACPLQVFIRNSALKCFLFAAFLMGYYQYFLTIKNYTFYLLDDRIQSRQTFLDANKEGIISCVGYLAIYLFSQAICMRLSAILNKYA